MIYLYVNTVYSWSTTMSFLQLFYWLYNVCWRFLLFSSSIFDLQCVLDAGSHEGSRFVVEIHVHEKHSRPTNYVCLGSFSFPFARFFVNNSLWNTAYCKIFKFVKNKSISQCNMVERLDFSILWRELDLLIIFSARVMQFYELCRMMNAWNLVIV